MNITTIVLIPRPLDDRAQLGALGSDITREKVKRDRRQLARHGRRHRTTSPRPEQIRDAGTDRSCRSLRTNHSWARNAADHHRTRGRWFGHGRFFSIADGAQRVSQSLRRRRKAVFRSVFRNLRLALKGRSLTPQQFHHDFANTLAETPSIAAFERYVVPAPNHILQQFALANFSSDAPSTVRFHNDSRAPLLLVAGGEDRVMPSSMVNANFDSYRESKAETDYKEFPNEAHFTFLQETKVADYVLGWALSARMGRNLPQFQIRPTPGRSNSQPNDKET